MNGVPVWLYSICAGLFLIGLPWLVLALCKVAARADEQAGRQEWQQQKGKVK